MGLNVSPPIWQTYINTILNCLGSRKYCEVIMDDVLLFTPSKQSHMRKLEDLLKALLKNGLKISPRKCQLLMKELQYMGNTIFIQEKRVCPPTTVKGCGSFTGMVNFLSIFCQDLQKPLKPIYDWTTKGRSFIWEEEQQVAFEEIKKRLQKHPFYIYQITWEDSTYIQIQVNMPQAVPCIKCKMESPN